MALVKLGALHMGFRSLHLENVNSYFSMLLEWKPMRVSPISAE